jgi:Kdo2-lipid IVA lauroyltransferase/acyltransferase
LLRLLEHLVCGLSLQGLRRIGRILGRLVFSVLRIRRRVTVGNIQRALGLSAAESVRLARRVYENLGIGALEFMRVGKMTPQHAQAIMGQPGLSKLQQQLERSGRGLLVLSAHLGNWDMLACAAARCGLPVNVITRQIKTGWVNRFWMNRRRECGVNLLPAQGSAVKTVRALRDQEVVALVLDQHEPGGVPTPFFGRPAATGAALARLALATGAPVVPAFLLRTDTDEGFQLQVGEALELSHTGRREIDIKANTQLFTQQIEAQVRLNPDQWLWLHRRWKLQT